jgi:hypothetical protein
MKLRISVDICRGVVRRVGRADHDNDENLSTRQSLELTYLINDVDPFMELSILFIRGMGDLLNVLLYLYLYLYHYSPPPTSVFNPK